MVENPLEYPLVLSIAIFKDNIMKRFGIDDKPYYTDAQWQREHISKYI